MKFHDYLSNHSQNYKKYANRGINYGKEALQHWHLWPKLKNFFSVFYAIGGTFLNDFDWSHADSGVNKVQKSF